MSLWYEHTGLAEEIFLEPESLGCAQKMFLIGEKMWKVYSGEEVVDMEGVHLVNYPLIVTRDGFVEDLVDGGGNFPDTKSPVKGRRSKLPPIFTT
ncbi:PHOSPHOLIPASE D [Salix viminalis]|nr:PHOSPHOLIPASE D [Salix viminalis]